MGVHAEEIAHHGWMVDEIHLFGNRRGGARHGGRDAATHDVSAHAQARSRLDSHLARGSGKRTHALADVPEASRTRADVSTRRPRRARGVFQRLFSVVSDFSANVPSIRGVS